MTTATYADSADTLKPEDVATGDVIELINSFFPEPLIEPERDPEQAWFWTSEWQESVERSLAQIERGEGVKFDTNEDFLIALDGE